MSYLSQLVLTWGDNDEAAGTLTLEAIVHSIPGVRSDVARINGAVVTDVKVWLEQTDGEPGYHLKLEADLPELPATIPPPVFP